MEDSTTLEVEDPMEEVEEDTTSNKAEAAEVDAGRCHDMRNQHDLDLRTSLRNDRKHRIFMKMAR